MYSFRVLTSVLLMVTAMTGAAQQVETPTTDQLALAYEPVIKAPTQLDTGSALNQTDVDAWLDGFLPYALEIANIPGAVVVVVADGEVLTQRGYGYANIEKRLPVDPESTLFRPGSVSKLITWTAVMQLVESGKINLDEDVNSYLDFSVPSDGGKPITMRQLLTHTPGLEDIAKNLLFTDRDRLMSLGDYLKDWVPEQIFEPGTTPAYSNYGSALAGYIIERVSGQSFDDYLDEHIFEPLNMQNSTFRQPLPKRLEPMMSQGYGPDTSKPEMFELLGPAPAGSMSSTGADMARFMIAHLQQGATKDGRILSAETVRLMHDTPLTLLPPLNRMQLGFFETNINGQQVIAHLGDTRAFHTALHLFLDENTGLYFSTNGPGKAGAAGGLRTALFQKFADRYFPAQTGDETEDEVGEAKLETGNVEKMAGVWRVSRGSRSNFFSALGLLGQTKVIIGSDGELLVPDLKKLNGSPKKWVEVEPFLWHEVNGHDRLAAVVENGQVLRWSTDGVSPFMVFERVPASISSSWLLPALSIGLVALSLTFLFWPINALVRRRYQAPLAVQGRDRLVYRLVRVFSGLTLGVLLGWVLVINAMMKDFGNMSSIMDPWLWLLQISGLVVFVGALAVMVWNAGLAWSGKRRWTSKLWSLILVLSSASLLWMAFAYKLIAFTVNF